MKIYDIIKIKDLEIFANHGVFPEETRLGQKFLVSITMYTDTRKAGMTDDLTASIHYGEVSRFVDSYLKEHTFLLIERAAEALARELLLGTPHLEKVWVEIKKPWAGGTSDGYGFRGNRTCMAYSVYCAGIQYRG